VKDERILEATEDVKSSLKEVIRARLAAVLYISSVDHEYDIFVSIDFIDERFEPEAVLRRIRTVTDQCERVSSLRAHVSAHK
jgi:hypothetical protein